MDLTEHHDLRSGDPHWDDRAAPPPADPLPSAKVDVAIVGCGIMGAMLAERLARDGKRVALLDRRPPAHGSTAASTALVMWEMDVPLTQLAETIGIEEATRRWRRVHEAVVRLKARIDADGLECDAELRPILYLDGPVLPGEALVREGAARRAGGLPSDWLDAEAITARFGIAPRAALVSGDSFAVDPVKLTLALLDRARANGATISYPADVTGIEKHADGIALVSDAGMVIADRAILAPGYERARLFLPAAFSILSSYAIATAPGTVPLWREKAMIWEAADPYLYTRTDADGRIIAGGEDEEFSDSDRRDALLEAKSGTIAAKLGALIGADVDVDRRWAATFGASPDGLPAIGRARNHDRLWLASGFGGNGVSFAALAAELLAAEFAGRPDPMAAAFDPYRFED
ncbi:FAD-binding oxidoreductase [Sphingomonas koreensis]|nr:FAD-binding oxidoreductase [Sphingomonas koreensis]